MTDFAFWSTGKIVDYLRDFTILEDLGQGWKVVTASRKGQRTKQLGVEKLDNLTQFDVAILKPIERKTEAKTESEPNRRQSRGIEVIESGES